MNIRTDECRTGQIGEAEIYILKVAIIEIGICQFGVRKVNGLEIPPGPLFDRSTLLRSE